MLSSGHFVHTFLPISASADSFAEMPPDTTRLLNDLFPAAPNDGYYMHNTNNWSRKNIKQHSGDKQKKASTLVTQTERLTDWNGFCFFREAEKVGLGTTSKPWLVACLEGTWLSPPCLQSLVTYNILIQTFIEDKLLICICQCK